MAQMNGSHPLSVKYEFVETLTPVSTSASTIYVCYR